MSAAACEHLVDVYQQEQEWQQAVAIAERLAAGEPGIWKPRIAHYYCELGEAALQRQDVDGATAMAQQALQQDPGCVRATLLKGQCLRRAGDLPAAIDTWKSVEQQNSALMPEVIDEIRSCYAQAGATDAWQDYARGLEERHDRLAQQAFDRQLRYCCEKCGFSSRKLFWQCPGCRCWSSVKPIQPGNEA